MLKIKYSFPKLNVKNIVIQNVIYGGNKHERKYKIFKIFHIQTMFKCYLKIVL